MDEREREHWRSLRRTRPAVVEPAGAGRESVWDYPRPPRVEPVAAPIRVEFAGRPIAHSQRALRVIETASPPVYYLPPQDVDHALLAPVDHETWCEWKGRAHYFDLVVPDLVVPERPVPASGAKAERRVQRAAWSYPEPAAGFEAIRDFVAFFPARVDACFVGDERARPQPGGYYGGWVTDAIAGPFKGEPGTEGW